MSEVRPTSGVDAARMLAAANQANASPDRRLARAHDAHNAVTAVVMMYGGIVMQQKEEIDRLYAEILQLRARLLQAERTDDRKDFAGTPST